MSRTLHIISFSVPWPPDYGGAMDVFYKLRALHAAGVKIILHCFLYNRTESSELLKYCSEVYYYRRNPAFINQLSRLPYIIKSRESKLLLSRLAADTHPILFEGLHTTLYLGHPLLSHKQQWVRAHNIEHDYYLSLARAESVLYRKLYFKVEAWKLKRYCAHLSKAAGVFAISPGDEAMLVQDHLKTYLIPAFHGYNDMACLVGKGDYLLYHGDLSIPENHRSVDFLLDVCKNLGYQLVIAGKNPLQKLRSQVLQMPFARLVENPEAGEMHTLIREAGTILLPANQTTGLRLKLLVSLFTGRHCIASPQMVEKTGLEKLCHIAENKEEWQKTIKRCMTTPFTLQHIEQRKAPLTPFLDEENALRIRKIIFGA
jgi:hypothetical protein